MVKGGRMKVYLVIIFACLSCDVLADSLKDAVLKDSVLTDEITKPIIAMFDAMREHDGDKLKRQFVSTAILQRALSDGSIRTSDISKFAQKISESKSYLDEHLLAVKVNLSDNLASVWTPYAFYLDNKLSHCGVNSFQLVKTAKGWKIQYLIDNSHQADCRAFINLHAH